MPQDLSVRGQVARRWAVVFHIVLKMDGVLAALENECLGDGEALAVRPGQGYAQLISARREDERRLIRLPQHLVRGRGFTRAAYQAALQQVTCGRRFVAQQPHGNIRCVLAQGVLQQVGAIEFAALEVDGDVQHVGGDMQLCGRPIRFGCGRGGGRRGRSCGGGRVGRRRRCRRRGQLRHRVAERARRCAGGGRTWLSDGADRRLVVMQPGLIIQKQDRGEDAPKHQTDIRHGSVSCPARGRSRLARMDDNVAGGASRARTRAQHHSARSRYAHSRSNWDRSGSWASASG